MRGIIVFILTMLMAGCSATSDNVSTLVLPTSNKKIDVVQHRSNVRAMDCGTLVVLQTYNGDGNLIDSKEARGSALHCDVLITGMQVGGAIGAANQIRKGLTAADGTTVSNVNSNEQSQGQSQVQAQTQAQAQGQTQVSKPVQINKPVYKPTKHEPSPKSPKGPKGPKGNNGFGNGGNDGSPNKKSDSDR